MTHIRVDPVTIDLYSTREFIIGYGRPIFAWLVFLVRVRVRLAGQVFHCHPLAQPHDYPEKGLTERSEEIRGPRLQN